MGNKIYNKICEFCGKGFTTKTSFTKYCSRNCKDSNKEHYCLYCNKLFKGKRDRVYCSDDCKNKDKNNRLERTKKTNLKKYGVENPFQAKEIKEKIKNKLIEKYGVDNPAKNNKVKDKIRKTCVEKYGVDWGAKSKEAKEKTKNTCIEKYGVDNPSKKKEFKEKIKKTCLERYGVKNVSLKIPEVRKKYENTCMEKYGCKIFTQSKKFKNRYKETCLERYGETHFSKTKKFKNRYKETCLERYGVFNNKQIHIKNIKDLNKDFFEKNFIKDNFFLLTDACNYFNIQRTAVEKYKKQFNIIEPNKNEIQKTQKEIYSFIKSFYANDVISNDYKTIKPLQLDIFIPDKKLAIEYNGLIFHSFGKNEKINFLNNYDEEKTDYNYHLNKTQLCEEKGIKLFHIFENEWLDEKKQEIWKSKIKLELDFIDEKINARDCEIKTVNNDDTKIFLINNHLQGNSTSSIKLGLFFNNELVYLMTFGKSRFNKKYDWELIRACSKINTIVRGGFSKLLKYFKNNYKGSIISYGNRRWTFKNKNIYGNNLLKEIHPNYFYFEKNNVKKLESRLKYQKHKLKDLLENFDEKLTETENMYNNGFRKVYDCGNLVYGL